MKVLIENLLDALSVGGLYALVALGIAVVFSIMRLVNFAHGDLIMIAGFSLLLFGGHGWIAVVAGPVAVGVVVAIAMERVAFRPVRSSDLSTMLITSFALNYFIQSVAIMVEGSLPKPVNVSNVVTQSFLIGSLEVPKLDPITIAITAATLIALSVFLNRTRLGLQMRAASEDFRMARLLGVRANGVIVIAFAISGALAGIVAPLVVSQSGVVYPTMGLSLVLVGFVGCVIGGLGSLVGACIGGLLLGVTSVGLQVWLPQSVRPFRDAFLYSFVILLLVVRPRGLMGERLPQGRI